MLCGGELTGRNSVAYGDVYFHKFSEFPESARISVSYCEHLRICPQGYTCCTTEMEENFANISKMEFDNSLRESSLSVQGLLFTQNRNFDRYFLDLLNKSEQILMDTFPNLYGELYTQNDGKIFRDLYIELRQYYRGSGVNLEEALTEFWSHLLESVFKTQNSQFTFSYEYLDCLAKQYDQLKPFGDIPREMKLKATRAFIAARSFVQGLGAAADIVRKVTQTFLLYANPNIVPFGK
ncbi:unnamed protein product [Ranitomeya imitator]|uniref:Glypican-1 n=1 Tax=Ranitomeya imitator TaxID=111125 RepID=A0ABN9LP00_9NEOB|nr:unnamed protein product [Ranitomeya imitator]